MASSVSPLGRLRRHRGLTTAAVGLSLALLALALQLTIFRPHPASATVGPLRTLVTVNGNLSAGISFWTDGTVVFGDGNHITALEPDGSQWTVAQVPGQVRDIAAIPGGPLYFSADDGKVRQYFGGQVTTVLDRPVVSSPRGVGVAPDGSLYVADISTEQVLRRTPHGKVTVIGMLDMPNDLAIGALGEVFVTDSLGKVYKVAGQQLERVFDVNDARPRADRQLPGYIYICSTPNDDLIVGDEMDNAIWRIHLGRSHRVLGNFTSIKSPDGTPGRLAAISSPWAVAVTNDYRLIMSEAGRLRVVQLAR